MAGGGLQPTAPTVGPEVYFLFVLDGAKVRLPARPPSTPPTLCKSCALSGRTCMALRSRIRPRPRSARLVLAYSLSSGTCAQIVVPRGREAAAVRMRRPAAGGVRAAAARMVGLDGTQGAPGRAVRRLGAADSESQDNGFFSFLAVY